MKISERSMLNLHRVSPKSCYNLYNSCREKSSWIEENDAEKGASLHVCNIRSPSWPSSFSPGPPIAAHITDLSIGNVPTRRKRLRAVLRQIDRWTGPRRFIGEAWQWFTRERVLEPRRVKCSKWGSRSQTIRSEDEKQSALCIGIPSTIAAVVGVALPSDRHLSARAQNTRALQFQIAFAPALSSW